MNKYKEEFIEKTLEGLSEKINYGIKFIYINNSQVSKWLCGDFLKTIDNFENIPVFYGGMISGGKMDAFSKKRLVNEIRSYLKKGN